MSRTDERPAGGIPTGLSESHAATKRHSLEAQPTGSDARSAAPGTYDWHLSDRLIAMNHRTIDQVVSRLLQPPRRPRATPIRQTDDWPAITMPGGRQLTAA